MTLIELMVVVAIIGVLATITINVLTRSKPQRAISLAPKSLATALESTRSYALAAGRNVVFVVLGNTDPVTAARCGDGLQPIKDSRCVRYWIVEDQGTGDARFDATELASFNPDTFTEVDVAGRGRVRRTADGDYVLESGTLPRHVYFGRQPGYTVATLPANSVFQGVPLATSNPPCSVCTGTPPRGFVRFSPSGDVFLPTNRRGEVFYLAAADDSGPLADTRAVVILQPSGIILDRIFKSE